MTLAESGGSHGLRGISWVLMYGGAASHVGSSCMDYDFERAAAAARSAEGHYESLHVSFLLSSFARDTLVLKA